MKRAAVSIWAWMQGKGRMVEDKIRCCNKSVSSLLLMQHHASAQARSADIILLLPRRVLQPASITLDGNIIVLSADDEVSYIELAACRCRPGGRNDKDQGVRSACHLMILFE